jgi:predicted phosphodiesterase
VLVFGDLHCDRPHLRVLIERAVEERCDALVSLGDLCYLPREPEGRRFLHSAGALLRRAGLELLLVDGNHDDAEALASASARTPAPVPVALGFRIHHLPAGTRFRLGSLRCLAYGGAYPVRSRGAGRDWHRAAARERSALKRLAGGGEIDLLFCHDPRTLEQGAEARGSFAPGGDAGEDPFEPFPRSTVSSGSISMRPAKAESSAGSLPRPAPDRTCRQPGVKYGHPIAELVAR